MMQMKGKLAQDKLFAQRSCGISDLNTFLVTFFLLTFAMLGLHATAVAHRM